MRNINAACSQEKKSMINFKLWNIRRRMRRHHKDMLRLEEATWKVRSGLLATERQVENCYDFKVTRKELQKFTTKLTGHAMAIRDTAEEFKQMGMFKDLER